MLARALAKKPRLLLIDEPTALMNQQQKQPLLNLISNLKNVTFLIASNDESVQKLADRILKIENGKLVFDGNYESFSKI